MRAPGEPDPVVTEDPDLTPRERAAIEALHRSEHRFRSMVQNGSQVIATVDRDGRITYMSPSIQAVTGFPPEHYVGSRVDEHVHPDDGAWAGFLRSIAEPRSVLTDQKRVARADSTTTWVECTRTNRLDDPDVGAVIYNFADISEHRAALDALRAGEQRFRVHARQQATIAALGTRALEESRPATWAQELLDGLVFQLQVDRASLFELDADDQVLVLRGGSGLPSELVDTLTVPATPDRLMGSVLQEGGAVAVDDFLTDEQHGYADDILQQGVRSGIAVAVGGHAGPWGVLAVGAGEPRVYTPEEVDFVTAGANVLAAAIERRRAEAALERSAHVDPLTGLANRAAFEEQALEALTTSTQHLVLVLLDVDSLKLVNDALGHTVGDAVLVSVAERVAAAVPEGVVVSRLDGDELAVLLTHPGDPPGPLHTAGVLSQALAPVHHVEGVEVFVPVSMGVASSESLDDDGPSTTHERLHTLVRHADQALQRAKKLGRGHVELFDGAMRDDAAARLAIANALRGAVDRGELSVCYQPEVALQGAGPLWVEALARWEHPDLGPVPPDRFVPIAEESGSIVEIGTWVLREACRQLRAWRSSGRPCPEVISVNLSPRQLAHPGLVSSVASVLSEEDVEPSALTLEITETAVMADPERSLETVQRLRDLGVLVAIDDFGTGYSSLAMLQRFPVSALKVDRSFVAGLDASESDRSIVTAVIGLARALGLITVAEGVETQEQLAVLLDLGCDFGQGYLWSKPLSPPDLADWCEAFVAGGRSTTPV